MNHFSRSRTKRKFAALAVLVLSATLSTQAAGHDDAPAEPFQMAVIIDDAYGRTVASGNYGTAIEKITAGSRKSNDDFSEQVNLCVAYAKSREIEKARTACDAAITYMSAQERRASDSNNRRKPALRVYRSNLAVALSNRGVLLAIAGDTELARRDFITAMAFDTRHSRFAASNLARLEQIGKPDA